MSSNKTLVEAQMKMEARSLEIKHARSVLEFIQYRVSDIISYDDAEESAKRSVIGVSIEHVLSVLKECESDLAQFAEGLDDQLCP